jgi:hypothetical protein
MAQSSNNRLLADLLKPGIQQSGWTSVAKLFLQVRKLLARCSSPGIHDRLLTSETPL